MKSFLSSLFFLVALSTCLVYSFEISSEKFKNSALRRLKRNIDQKLPEHQRPGNEVKKCDGDVSSWKKNNFDYEDEIIRDKDILPQLFHLNKEKFERCVMCEVISRDTGADRESTSSRNSFDIKLSKSICMNGDNFDKPDDLLLEKLQALVASVFEREKVLACTSVALQDAGIDVDEWLIKTADRENITRLYENILKCSEDDFYPLAQAEVKKVHCIAKHLKSKKMLGEKFNFGTERAGELAKCGDFLKAFEEEIHKDVLKWTAENQPPTFFNMPKADEKLVQCMTDELKVRGYVDLKLREKLFDILQTSSKLEKQQARVLITSGRSCEIAKLFDAAFDEEPRDMNETAEFHYSIRKYAIDNKLIDFDAHNITLDQDPRVRGTNKLEKAALEDYIASRNLLTLELLGKSQLNEMITECTRRISGEEGFGDKIAALFALGQLNITDQQKQYERTKFTSTIKNLTEKVVKCLREKRRNDLDGESENRFNCIVKDLKNKNILNAEFFEFNQTYDAEKCHEHDLLERMKNAITAGSYDGCSVDELNSYSNWDHLFKLYVSFIAEISFDKLEDFYKYEQNMEQLLRLKCGFEKRFRYLLDHPMNSKNVDKGKTEALCIKKYVIDKKLIDNEKVNVTEIDATRCEAIIVKNAEEINYKIFSLVEKVENYYGAYNFVPWCALPIIREANIPDKIFAAQAFSGLNVDKERKEFANIAKNLTFEITSCITSWSQA